MKEALTLFGMSLLLALILCLIMSYPVMWIWNTCLVPAVNTLEFINYWQALGILFIVRVLSASQISVNRRDS